MVLAVASLVRPSDYSRHIAADEMSQIESLVLYARKGVELAKFNCELIDNSMLSRNIAMCTLCNMLCEWQIPTRCTMTKSLTTTRW